PRWRVRPHRRPAVRGPRRLRPPPAPVSLKTVSLVGSTGSIGTQAVDVVRAEPDRYRVIALGAFRSVDVLAVQAKELRPERVAIADPALEDELRAAVPEGTEVLAGPGALAAIAVDADVVVNG